MFILFLISFAPFFTAVSWDFFNSDRNFFAVFFGYFVFRSDLIAFCKSGSVGLTSRILLAEALVGSNKNASIPAFATFSAPCILTDFMSDSILLKRLAVTSFFILRGVNKTLKTYLCTRSYGRGVAMIELIKKRGVESLSILPGVSP